MDMHNRLATYHSTLLCVRERKRARYNTKHVQSQRSLFLNMIFARGSADTTVAIRKLGGRLALTSSFTSYVTTTWARMVFSRVAAKKRPGLANHHKVMFWIEKKKKRDCTMHVCQAQTANTRSWERQIDASDPSHLHRPSRQIGMARTRRGSHRISRRSADTAWPRQPMFLLVCKFHPRM